MSKIIFTFEGNKIEMQCSNEDKMKDICIKLAIKIDKNINNLYFIYDGNIINLELKYKEIINSINLNEMNILVYEREGIICPKCGENIIIDINKDNIEDKLIGIKDQIEIITTRNNISINKIIIQLKNIMILIDNILKEKKKIEVNNINNICKVGNLMKGIIDIEIKDISKEITLYNSEEEI